MLTLTKEEVALLLHVSTMDVYNDYSGGPDTSWRICPLCGASISEDDKVSDHVSEEFFNREILPKLESLREEWGEDYVLYNKIYCYEIYSDPIPMPHKEGCKIEDLKALHKKMKDFVGD
jgi:hypothetical protein